MTFEKSPVKILGPLNFQTHSNNSSTLNNPNSSNCSSNSSFSFDLGRRFGDWANGEKENHEIDIKMKRVLQGLASPTSYKKENSSNFIKENVINSKTVKPIKAKEALANITSTFEDRINIPNQSSPQIRTKRSGHWTSLRFKLKNLHLGPQSTGKTEEEEAHLQQRSLWIESITEELQEFLQSDCKRIEYPNYLTRSERACVIQLAAKMGLADTENGDTLSIFKPLCASPMAIDGTTARPDDVFVDVGQLATKGKDSFLRVLRLRRFDSAGGSRGNVLWEAAESAKSQGVSAVEDGDGGVYAMHASDGKNVAMFKPMEEERFVREGLQPGEGAVREEAAYVLDSHSGGFSGVPATAVAQLNISDKGQAKHGSVQRFMPSKMGSMADFGMPHALDKAIQFVGVLDVHKIAILDIRLFNTDRHPGNILLVGDRPPYGLVPIDHGCILPSWFHLSEARFDWMEYPQAKVPLTSDTLSYIKNLDYGKDAKDLRKLGIREECITTMKICTMLLKICAADGMSLYEIGSVMQRTGCLDQPSQLELLILEACDACKIGFRFVANKYQEKTGVITQGILSRRPPQKFLDTVQSLIKKKIVEGRKRSY